MAVLAINATMTGLTPFNPPWTNLFFKNLEITIATRIMMINDGRTTPKVAHIAPKMPPVCEPTNVDILMAKGPGVDSLIAIKSLSSPSLIHPRPTIWS